MKIIPSTLIKIIMAIILLISLFFVSTIVLSTTSSAAETTTVRVDPSYVDTTLYDIISISVIIENVENMSGYQFKLNWNSSILKCTQWNYTSSTWIEDPSVPPYTEFFVGRNNITDMPDGTTEYWNVVVDTGGAPVLGTFTVATISFNYTNIGETSLDLSDTVLGDQLGTPIPHNVVDGVVIPEFLSFLILPLFMIATLLAVLVYRRKNVKHNCMEAWETRV